MSKIDLNLYRFELPFPPSTNHYYKRFRNRTYISPAGRKYRQKVADMAMDQFTGDKLWFDRLTVSVIFYPPDDKDRDLDNYLKPLLDGLRMAGIYRDDSQIDILHLKWSEIDKNGGRACVAIRSLWK